MKMGFPERRMTDFLAARMVGQDGDAHNVREDALSLLFDEQVQTLADRKCPEGILKNLQRQKIYVIAEAAKMFFPPVNLPFLPVIPGDILPIEEQVGMIIAPSNGTKAICRIEPKKFNSYLPDESPCFVYNVENGAKWRNMPPKQSREIFKENKRLGLNTEGIISLAIHSDALSYHNLLAVASSDNKSIPRLPALLLRHGTPRLCGIFEHDLPNYRRWGTPSCTL